MKLLSFFLKCLLFVALVFIFTVLFQYGPNHFGQNSQTELDYWRSKFSQTPSEN